MKNFIQKLIEKNTNEVNLQEKFNEIDLIKQDINTLTDNNPNIPTGPGKRGGSPSKRDLYFWYLVARTFKPQTVFEIGAWAGTTSLVIAKALNEIYGDNFKIITCDGPTDVYQRNHNYQHLSKNIEYYCMYSDGLIPQLKNQKIKFNAIFSDAGISNANVNDISSICDINNFFFLTHDVYTNRHAKGNDALNKVTSRYSNMTTIKPTDIDGHILNSLPPINASTGITISTPLYESII